MFRGTWLAKCFHSEKICWLGKGFGCKREYKSAPLQERKMIDRKQIHVKGGNGGDGCTSFRRSRHDRYGEADGGRGGRGGDVVFLCTDEIWDYSHLQHHFNAKNGGPGSSKKRIGSRGEDKVIRVPMGTVIHLIDGEIPLMIENDKSFNAIPENNHDAQEESEERVLEEPQRYSHLHDADDSSGLVNRSFSKSLENHDYTLEERKEQMIEEPQKYSKMHDADDSSGLSSLEVDDDASELSSGEVIEDSESDNNEDEEEDSTQVKMKPKFVAELLKAGETLTVALGGEGGRGNASMARGVGSKKKLPSREHEEGHLGTHAYLALELKTIADVGFVGAPNAGKSTLLGAISRAKPKVGHYAFTTLRPNLGKLEFEDYFSITVADIPGLIKGAHKNVGLGHDFLRHVERTKVLAFVIDLSGGSGNNTGSPPWIQFEDLKFELEMYQPGLSHKPTIIVGTKIDEKGASEGLQELRSRLPSVLIVPVCAPLEQGINDLRLALRELVTLESPVLH